MATVKINNINTFNNTVLDLKSKVESSLKTDITSINSVLNNIENYNNNGFNANIGDIANTLKSNLESILKNITNAEKNLFNYASYINEFNVDDYNQEAKATSLETLYNEKYLGIKNGTDYQKGNNENVSRGPNRFGEVAFLGAGNGSYTSKDNYSSSSSGSSSSSSSSSDTSTSMTLESYLDTIEGTTIPISTNVSSNSVILNITDVNNVNPYTLTIVNNQVYNQEGLATFQDRYIISASKDFGMVGDLIDIKHNDGTVLKCIIGNVEESLTTPTINFVVNQNVTNTIQTLHPNWLNSINEVKNKGNFFNYIK